MIFSFWCNLAHLNANIKSQNFDFDVDRLLLRRDLAISPFKAIFHYVHARAGTLVWLLQGVEMNFGLSRLIIRLLIKDV